MSDTPNDTPISTRAGRTVRPITFGVGLLLLCLLAVSVGCTNLPSVSPTTPRQPSPTPTLAPTATATAVPIPGLVALAQRANGKDLAAGAWAPGEVTVSFGAASAGSALLPEVQVAPAGGGFDGATVLRGTPAGADPSATFEVALGNLTPGRYRWRARLTDPQTGRSSEWVDYAQGGEAFALAGPPPTVSALASDGAHSDGGQVVVGPKDQPSLRWSVQSEPADALDHLALLLDQKESAADAPPASARVLPDDARSSELGDLADGQWYAHVWAVDRLGRAGAPQTLALQVLRTPPTVSNVLFRSWATNPDYQVAPISFHLDRKADVDVTILDRDGKALRSYRLTGQSPDRDARVEWDGKDERGQVVPVGQYRFLITVADALGNRNEALYSGLQITDKVIRVSLSKQEMVASTKSGPFLTTIVTTGGQDLATKTGQFEVLSKESPFTFHSPFPPGSPYWYPDSKATYAMLFDQAEANFIHDSPWRTEYGPGTNGPGTPGQPRTGSHGCVDTPPDAMVKLFPWTPLGTPVFIEP